ncbi:hypothetical protein Scani_29150 [Streptomyces caniferus]|uniref:Uncharacterized protein n=1 Tax=Streptomyces caniferus TaxID=285557 RepID=A0A640S6H0_9ACTN|nr:hypothetical protein Scani_29150 [Streptomyces caniferus]
MAGSLRADVRGVRAVKDMRGSGRAVGAAVVRSDVPDGRVAAPEGAAAAGRP